MSVRQTPLRWSPMGPLFNPSEVGRRGAGSPPEALPPAAPGHSPATSLLPGTCCSPGPEHPTTEAPAIHPPQGVPTAAPESTARHSLRRQARQSPDHDQLFRCDGLPSEILSHESARPGLPASPCLPPSGPARHGSAANGENRAGRAAQGVRTSFPPAPRQTGSLAPRESGENPPVQSDRRL